MSSNLRSEGLLASHACKLPSLNRRRLLGLTASVFPTLAGAQDLATSYVRLWATRRISVEVPRSWALLDGNRRIDISAAGEAILRRTMPNEPVGRSDLPLAANRVVNSQSQAWMNIQTYPEEDLTQAESRRASAIEISAIDRELRRFLDPVAAQQGWRVASWLGTRRHLSRNGLYVFITNYQRTGIDSRPPATVYLASVLAGADSFTLTVAFNTDRAALYQPVAMEMIESLRVG
jgi:hypothetical protein